MFPLSFLALVPIASATEPGTVLSADEVWIQTATGCLKATVRHEETAEYAEVPSCLEAEATCYSTLSLNETWNWVTTSCALPDGSGWGSGGSGSISSYSAHGGSRTPQRTALDADHAVWSKKGEPELRLFRTEKLCNAGEKSALTVPGDGCTRPTRKPGMPVVAPRPADNRSVVDLDAVLSGRKAEDLTAKNGIPDDAEFFLIGDGLSEFRIELYNDFPPSDPATAKVNVLEYTWKYDGYAVTAWLVESEKRNWRVKQAVAYLDTVEF